MERYKYTNIKKKVTGERIYTPTIYPTVELSPNDIYIITSKGDRLDLLASRYYSRVSYWPVIAVANNLGLGTLIVQPGIQLRIPMNISEFKMKLEQLNK